jgi:hypothetical protein
VVAGVLEGRVSRTCRVDLPGGPLQIEWRESDNRIYMTGPARLVFAGEAEVALPPAPKKGLDPLEDVLCKEVRGGSCNP